MNAFLFAMTFLRENTHGFFSALVYDLSDKNRRRHENPNRPTNSRMRGPGQYVPELLYELYRSLLECFSVARVHSALAKTQPNIHLPFAIVNDSARIISIYILLFLVEKIPGKEHIRPSGLAKLERTRTENKKRSFQLDFVVAAVFVRVLRTAAQQLPLWKTGQNRTRPIMVKCRPSDTQILFSSTDRCETTQTSEPLFRPLSDRF